MGSDGRQVMERDYSRLARTAFARERVSALRTVVVGAGALGNEVLKNLALLGVGHVLVIDRDIVEASNLTRSVLYCIPDITDHIGRRTPKAVLAAARVAEINPDVRAEAIVGECADVGLGRVRRADVVFGCLDNELARLELGWACTRADRPLVDGGLGNLNPSSGAVSVYPGANGACYGCRKGPDARRRLLWELQGREDPCWLKERQQGIVATTPLLASVIGAVQVELGIRQVLDGGAADGGTFHTLSLHPSVTCESRHFDRSPACPLHEPASVMTGVLEARDLRAATATARDLLAAAGSGVGWVVFDWPRTARATCEACGTTWEPWARRARFRQMPCPSCGAVGASELEVVTEIGHESPRADVPLARLGVPAGHVVEVVTGVGEGATRVHVELTGDLVDGPEGPRP